mgnify:CR=1 FL=1
MYRRKACSNCFFLCDMADIYLQYRRRIGKRLLYPMGGIPPIRLNIFGIRLWLRLDSGLSSSCGSDQMACLNVYLTHRPQK